MVGKKVEEKKEHKPQEEVFSPDEKKRVYKPGPFALFYELNESQLDKDA